MPHNNEDSQWLTPAKVAAEFGVKVSTLVRWAKAGRISYRRTLGGHRRYNRDEVRTLVKASENPDLIGPVR